MLKKILFIFILVALQVQIAAAEKEYIHLEDINKPAVLVNDPVRYELSFYQSSSIGPQIPLITPAASGIALEGSDANFTTAQSASLTISSFGCSATNDYLVVLIALGNSSDVSTVTYGAESLSQQASRLQYTETFIWTAIPSAASGDIVVTPGSSTSIVARAMCFSGVDQGTPIDGTAGSTGAAASTSIANSITTVTNNAVVVSIAGLSTDSISGDAVQDGDQTNYAKVTATNYVIINGLTSTEVVPTAGAESNGYTWTESSDASLSQISLRPAS